MMVSVAAGFSLRFPKDINVLLMGAENELLQRRSWQGQVLNLPLHRGNCSHAPINMCLAPCRRSNAGIGLLIIITLD
jgi:hypothetical protein